MRKFLISLLTSVFLGCETSNYVPPVTTAMTRTTSRTEQNVEIARLEHGRTLFVNRCIECHTLPILWHYTSEDWVKIVNNMSHRASLKPAEREAIVAYILAVKTGKD